MAKKLSLQSVTRLIIGIFILVFSLLSYFHSIKWVFVLMFIGFNMIQFAFTNFCPLVIFLKKLGFK